MKRPRGRSKLLCDQGHIPLALSILRRGRPKAHTLLPLYCGVGVYEVGLYRRMMSKLITAMPSILAGFTPYDCPNGMEGPNCAIRNAMEGKWTRGMETHRGAGDGEALSMGLICPDCGLEFAAAPMEGSHVKLDASGALVKTGGVGRLSDAERRNRWSMAQIRSLGNRFELDWSAQEQAYEFFQKMLAAGAHKGRSRPLVEAVALYVAAIQRGYHLPLEEVVIAHTWRREDGDLRFKPRPWKPLSVNQAYRVLRRMRAEGVIPREKPTAREMITNSYTLRGEIGEDAYNRALEYTDVNIRSERPQVRAAAAVRVATDELGVSITFKHIIDAFKVPRSTGNKAVRHLKEALGRQSVVANPPVEFVEGPTGEQVRLLRKIRSQGHTGVS